MDPTKFKVNCGRFGASTKDEQEQIKRDRAARNTVKSVKCSIDILRAYLKEKSLPNIEDIDLDDLPEILSGFFTDARTKDGKPYTVGSMKSIRCNINRWFQDNRSVNIVTDPRFYGCNTMFKGIQVKGKREGRGERKSTEPISDGDMQLLANYFNIDHMNYPNPRILQRNVIFNIMYYTCRRGNENLYNMTDDWFELIVEANGERYIIQKRDELDKNHREDCSKNPNQGRMYEIPGPYHFLYSSLKF